MWSIPGSTNICMYMCSTYICIVICAPPIAPSAPLNPQGDPGLLPNEKTRGGGPQFILANSEVRRLIFSGSQNFLNKSQRFGFNCLTPKNRPFSSQNLFGFDCKFSFWFDILGLYTFPWHFFILGLYQYEKSCYLVKYWRFFLLFFSHPRLSGSQAWYILTRDLYLQKASIQYLGKSKEFSR